MKKLFIAVFSMVMLVFITQPVSVFAAGSDTLVVYASGSTLDVVIGSDTTATGTQAHSVYKLVSLDTTYLFDGTITAKSSLTIMGVPDPTTGRPPCIQPDVLGDGSVPGVLFTFSGNGNSFLLKNLYLLGIAINNTVNYGGGVGVQISADNMRLEADNVIFEQWSQFAIGYSGNWDKFFINNCRFRNMTTPPNQWYVGEVLRNENYLGSFPTDSIVIKNSTMLCVSGYATAATGGIVNYYEFSHNNVVFTFKNPFFLDRMVNAKFDNNIFYSAFTGGQNKTEFAGWDSFTPNTGPSIITMGLLDSTTASILLGHAATGPGDPAAEALRKVEVKNNVYYWPSAVTSFWTAWNDTAHVDSIYTPKFMNDTTAYMFNTKNLWPGFVESGNQSVDPVFGSSINGVLNAGTGNDIGLLNWFSAVRTGTGTTEIYGYKTTQVDFSTGNWVPAWPLPESADMKYSNASLQTGATDGTQIGDPSWFGSVTAVEQTTVPVPNKFELFQAYPNPFNPSTSIKFDLAQEGNVTLNVYNVMGQLVKTVVDNSMLAKGEHNYIVNMDNFASGIYFYTLRQGSNVITKKMVLLK